MNLAYILKNLLLNKYPDFSSKPIYRSNKPMGLGYKEEEMDKRNARKKAVKVKRF